MKIKAVCEHTGLSDRAVRLYIDSGLLSPDKTENYAGRRSFDFSQEDLSQLNRIAALRVYVQRDSPSHKSKRCRQIRRAFRGLLPK